MAGKALSVDQITLLLESGSSASDKARERNLKVNREGPVDVLTQPKPCVMCIRQNGPEVKAMYTVNDDPLCSPHAMYILSAICVDNGYDVSIAGKVEEVELPGQL